jgi:hypothetical protein
MFIFFSINGFGQYENYLPLPKYFYKKMIGNIGEKYSIEMELIKQDTILLGYYFYHNNKKPIKFTMKSNIDKNGFVYIEEDAGYDKDYNQIITGIFIGKFINDKEMEGNWTSKEGDKTFSFRLTEYFPEENVQLEMKKIERASGDCENKGCGSISFFFPYVKLIKDEKIAERINKNINYKLLEYYSEDGKVEHYKTIEERIDSFLNQYNFAIEYSDEYNIDYNIGWSNHFNILMSLNFNRVLSLQYNAYFYMGGAHGSFNIEFINYDLETGNEITLENIFIKNYEKKLNPIAEKIFRKKYKYKLKQDLEKEGFWFLDNKFTLNKNFGFTPEGILFQFNQYEIAPYAMGIFDVVIPYSDLKEIILPNSVLSRFYEK